MAWNKATENMAANIAYSDYAYREIESLKRRCERQGMTKAQAKKMLEMRIGDMIQSNINDMLRDYPLFEDIIPKTVEGLRIDCGLIAEYILTDYSPVKKSASPKNGKSSGKSTGTRRR